MIINPNAVATAPNPTIPASTAARILANAGVLAVFLVSFVFSLFLPLNYFALLFSS